MSGLGQDFVTLGRLLDVAGLRHRTIAANIANANTPGFKRLEVRFEEEFGRALERAGSAGAARVEPRVVQDDTPSAKLDGNNVETERELVDLSKNTLVFETLARVAAGKTALLRAAITGRSA